MHLRLSVRTDSEGDGLRRSSLTFGDPPPSHSSQRRRQPPTQHSPTHPQHHRLLGRLGGGKKVGRVEIHGDNL